MSESREEIVRVEVCNTGELLLVVGSGGKPEYQYIYGEARGVCWNKDARGFEGTERIEWSYPEWFAHIVNVCGDVGVHLRLSEEVEWVNVSDTDQQAISTAHGTDSQRPTA